MRAEDLLYVFRYLSQKFLVHTEQAYSLEMAHQEGRPESNILASESSVEQIGHALNLIPRWMTTNSPGRTISLTNTISLYTSNHAQQTYFPNSVCRSNRPWLGMINISPSLLQKALFPIDVLAA